MDLLDMKWRKYKERDHDTLVALKQPRLVGRMGYEVDFEEACRMVAREASFVPGDPRIEDAKQGLDDWSEPVRQTKDFDLRVVSTHPGLWKYWDDRANFRTHLKDLLEEEIGHLGIDSVMKAIDHSVVRSMVLTHLQAEIHGGQERKIWFKTPPETMILPGAKDLWRGPWRINGWRTMYTGTYYPGGNYGEDDYEPPILRGAKVHVLLRITHIRENAGWNEHVALKEDTYPWEQEAVAQKMLEGSGKENPPEYDF